MLLVQGWTETNPGRQERNKERSLQTQSPSPALPFTGAAAISGDREGLPQRNCQALKLCGMSIIPRKLTSSSAGECAHACAALAAPQPVERELQHPSSSRACAWLPASPRAAPASEKMEEDPYHSLQGWRGTFLGGEVLFSQGFAPEGTWLPLASHEIAGQCPRGGIRGKPELSEPQHAHPALLLAPWVALVWQPRFAPVLSWRPAGRVPPAWSQSRDHHAGVKGPWDPQLLGAMLGDEDAPVHLLQGTGLLGLEPSSLPGGCQEISVPWLDGAQSCPLAACP